MRPTCLGLLATAFLCAVGPAWAQTNVALTGQVTSAEEGAMEGVLAEVTIADVGREVLARAGVDECCGMRFAAEIEELARQRA